MSMLDSIFGQNQSNPAVPGGSLAKPITIALLALLASRMFGGGGKDAPAAAPAQPSQPSQPIPSTGASTPSLSPDGILGGLGGLLKQFQQNGQGDVTDSWVKSGPNKQISSGQLSDALGQQTLNDLSRQTGIPTDQLVKQLSAILPGLVDQLTPNGRLPTQQEINKLIS
jgi:uncharacterized protein YidB (DUF937 family)